MQKVFQSKKYKSFVIQTRMKGHGVFLSTIIFFAALGDFNLSSCITGFNQEDIGG